MESKDKEPEMSDKDLQETLECYAISAHICSEFVLSKLTKFQSEICKILIEDGSDDQKITSIKLVLLRKKLNEEEIPELDKTKVESMRKTLKLQLWTTIAERMTIEITKLAQVFDDIAEVIRSTKEPKVQLLEITNLVI